MTWIMLIPEELTATADLLRRTATELDDVAGQVHNACCACCAPAIVDGYVAEVVAGARGSVCGVGGDLRADAASLDASASVIATDSSLASSASAAWGPGAVSGGGLTDSWLAGMDGSGAGTVGGGLTDSWLAGMDSSPTTVGSGWTETWLPGMDAARINTGGLTDSWLGEMGSRDLSVRGWSPVPPANLDATGQAQVDVAIARLNSQLGLSGGGGSAVTGYTGNNAIAALEPYFAGIENMHALPTISDAFLIDHFNGDNRSPAEWAKDHGLNMHDPNINDVLRNT